MLLPGQEPFQPDWDPKASDPTCDPIHDTESLGATEGLRVDGIEPCARNLPKYQLVV